MSYVKAISTVVIFACCLPLVFSARSLAEDGSKVPRHSHYTTNRLPLIAKPYTELPLGTVKPNGWLLRQLESMANGMTGHLDELYPQVVGPRNGWLGGDGDGWERGPYWIDGLLPLAYILDDEELKAKALRWIEWTLANQTEDGYLGPVPFEQPPEQEPGLQRDKRRDWWPKMVMLKILQNYYNVSGDRRVIECLTKYFHYQLRELPTTPLGHWTFWANRRGGDNLMVVLWLYNITGDKQLLELAELIHKQAYAHSEEWLKPDGSLTKRQGMHCVNIAQGMKHPAIYYQLDGQQRHLDAMKKAFADLDRLWGMPTGLYGADEPLNSKEPTTGSEFCTAVEMMFSLEKMVEITGDTTFADRLELIAMNVLPTQATDDFKGKQYYSLVNQVTCTRHKKKMHITDHDGTDNVYGVLTGYPCCTTNLHQGWPKYVQHLWFASADDGLAAMVYAPCTVNAKVGDGTMVRIVEKTDYPFEDKILFEVDPGKPVRFALHLRVPSWCEAEELTVNGEQVIAERHGAVLEIKRRWQKGDRLELNLPMRLICTRWCKEAATIQRGPLLFALRIGERWAESNDNDQYGSYRECYPTGPWNFGLMEKHIGELDRHFKVVRRCGRLADNPWNIAAAPIEIHAFGRRIGDWKLVDQVAGPLPESPVSLADDVLPEPIVLIPYGCTTLRIAEFPVVR